MPPSWRGDSPQATGGSTRYNGLFHQLKSRLSARPFSQVVPAAVVAELTNGFHKLRDDWSQHQALARFLARPEVSFQPASYAIAMRWGFLAHLLRRKGRPIPVNDIWIAATTFETASILLSYDHHFDAIEGLMRIAP